MANGSYFQFDDDNNNGLVQEKCNSITNALEFSFLAPTHR